MTDIDHPAVSESGRQFLAVIYAGDMTATTATRYGIEGAIPVFSAGANGKVLSAADPLTWSGLQNTNICLCSNGCSNADDRGPHW